uniref:Uncharacterized protein n=1 Tax=Moniliophthora roreri TaxID=221103 RepID=A0A0W0FU40_MONRR
MLAKPEQETQQQSLSRHALKLSSELESDRGVIALVR